MSFFDVHVKRTISSTRAQFVMLMMGMVVTGVFASVNHASAMAVSPVKFDFEIAPGQAVQERIRLLNDTNQKETFTLFAENFIAQGEDGGQAYVGRDHSTGLASWIRPSAPSVTLNPGEAKEFPFLISIPQNAEPGGHYATIFFARAGNQSGGSGVGVAEEIGVLLLVRVPGNIREEASIESFRVIPDATSDRLPVHFELRIRNTGSVHLRPKGTIAVKNMLGYTVARVATNSQDSAVLPNSVRRLISSWVKAEDLEEGFLYELVNEWRNFAIGRYTATAELTYGSRNIALSHDRIVFWVWPWRLMIVFVLLLMTIVFGIKGYNRMIVRMAVKNRK